METTRKISASVPASKGILQSKAIWLSVLLMLSPLLSYIQTLDFGSLHGTQIAMVIVTALIILVRSFQNSLNSFGIINTQFVLSICTLVITVLEYVQNNIGTGLLIHQLIIGIVLIIASFEFKPPIKGVIK